MHMSDPEATKVDAQSQPDDPSRESPQNDVASSDSQHIPVDQPSRALSLGAKLYVWSHNEKSRDQVEHDFWSMIQEGAPDPPIRSLEDYGEIKSYPGRVIFNHSLWYTAYQSYVEEHRLNSEFRAGDLTFSKALDKLGEHLRSIPVRPTMKLWFVLPLLLYPLLGHADYRYEACYPPIYQKKISSRMYSFGTKFSASPIRLKQMYQVPIDAILHVIRKEWGPGHPCLPRPGLVTKSLFPIVKRQSRLPSKGAQRLIWLSNISMDLVNQQKVFSIAKGGHTVTVNSYPSKRGFTAKLALNTCEFKLIISNLW
jgi:hypothetical protein